MHDITWNHTGAGRCWSLDVGGSTTSVGSTRSGTPPPRRASSLSSLVARRSPRAAFDSVPPERESRRTACRETESRERAETVTRLNLILKRTVKAEKTCGLGPRLGAVGGPWQPMRHGKVIKLFYPMADSISAPTSPARLRMHHSGAALRK